MKLILTSNSISTPIIAEKVIDFVGKPAKDIKFAIINEAYSVEEGSHEWLLKSIDYIRKYFKTHNLEFINLLALDITQVERRIKNADVIFCCGGNTEYLQTVFQKTGFDKLLLKLLKTKVFVGTSAGSMVVGKLPNIETLNAIYNVTDLYGIRDYLSYFNFSILPHINKKGFNKNFQHCIKESLKQPYPVYSLSDTSAVVVDDKKTYMIGKNCYKILNGKVIEKLD